MEKYFLYLFLILFFCSCKNSSEEDTVIQKESVVISLDQVKSSLPEIKSASTLSNGDSLLNKLDVIYYLVFDATGKYMHQKKQLRSDVGFGEIKDELKVGQYTIVLFSCTDELNLGSTFSALSNALVRTTAKTGDIYYKKMQINVTDQGITQSVLLNRIVGCVQIRVKDRIADNVTKIELLTADEMPYFSLNTDKAQATPIETRSTSVIVDDTNRSSLTLGLLLLNDQVPMTIIINLYDASNKVIKTKRIANIVNVRGQKVSVEGRLSDFMSAGFTIGYDTSSPMDSTIVNF